MLANNSKSHSYALVVKISSKLFCSGGGGGVREGGGYSPPLSLDLQLVNDPII